MNAQKSIVAVAALATLVATGLPPPSAKAWGRATGPDRFGRSERQRSDDVVRHIGSNMWPVNVGGSQMLLPYELNHAVDHPANFTRLVVLIHGMHRKVTLARGVQDALGVVNRPDTLLFIPQFLNDRDHAAHKLPDDMLFWRDSWKWGDPSSGAKRIGSFEVLDQIIFDLSARYPSIREVVIMGNSAGGQFTQRYAALSPAEDIINSKGRRIAFRYLASNPSSYLYFDNKRVSPSGRLEVPASSVVNSCSKYNTYGYGLENPNPYASRSSIADISARLLRRTVVYFIGNDDDDEDHPLLDTRCAAELQGAERFARSQNYWQHLLERFGRNVTLHQRRICVDHGTHNSRTIWGTSCGAFYISGEGSCSPSPCPE